MSFWDGKEVKRLFRKLPFYYRFIEKPCIKRPKKKICCKTFHFIMN